MKFKLFFTALLALALVGCDKDDRKGSGNPPVFGGKWVGEWMLSTWNGSEELAGKIYIAFEKEGGFVLYQSVDMPGYTVFRGSYVVTADGAGEDRGVLSGTYEDGAPLDEGSYEIEYDKENMLTLTGRKSGIVSEYERCTIPDYVKDGITGRADAGCGRFL